MLTINQAQDLVDRLRKTNPQASSMSDTELASAWQRQAGTSDMEDYIKSSGFRRGLGKVLQGYEEHAVEPVRKAAEYITGASPNEGFLSNLAASAVETLPETAVTLGAISAAPATYGASLLGIPAAAEIARERTLNKTGDPTTAWTVFGTNIAAGALAPAGASLVSRAAATKLGESAAATFASKVLGSGAVNVALNVPNELVAPTGTGADENLFDRAWVNAKRMLSPGGLGELVGSNLALALAGEAAGAGTKFVAKRAKQLASNKLVNPEQDVKFNSYNDARDYLTSQGITRMETNTPTLVRDLAERHYRGDVDTDEARYVLLRNKLITGNAEDISPDDMSFMEKYRTEIAPRTQAEKAKQILLATSTVRGRPDARGLKNLLTIVNHQGVQDYAIGNPAGYSDYVSVWDTMHPLQKQELLGNSDVQGVDALNGARDAIMRYRNGEISASDLSDVHPALLKMASNGDAYIYNLFKDEDLIKNLGKDGNRSAEQLADLQNELNKQSKAYQILGSFLDADSVETSSGIGPIGKLYSKLFGKTENPSIFDNLGKQEKLTPFEKYTYSSINLGTRFPFSAPMVDHLFHFTQRAKADKLDIIGKLGQDAEGSLPAKQAFQNAENFLNTVSSKDIARMSRAFASEQKSARTGGNLIDDGTLSKVFGITGDLLKKYKVLRDMPVDTARLIFNKERDINRYNLAGVIYLASNKRFSQDNALTFAKQLQDLYERQPIPKGNTSEFSDFVTKNVAWLKQVTKNLGTEFSDSNANVVLRTLLEQKSGLEKFQASHSILGYLPQQRRGKFGVTLYKPGFTKETASSKDMLTVDGDSAGEVQRRIDSLVKQGYTVNRSSAWNKDQWKRNEPFVSYDNIRALRQDQASSWRAIMAELDKTGSLNPELKEQFENIAAGFDPIEEAYQRSVEGSAKQYNLHRADIPGFQASQYLPNILDYVRINTDAIARRTTKAMTDFELMRPEYDSVQGLKNEWQDRVSYAFGLDDKTINQIRTMTTHLTIGASVKNALLNSTQNFFSGIGPMMEETGSYKTATRAMLEGLNIMTKYNVKGTTGNRYLDSIIRQADKDGVTTTDNLDLFFNTKSLENFGRKRLLNRTRNSVADYINRLALSTNSLSERQNRLYSLISMANLELKKYTRSGLPVSSAALSDIYTKSRRFSNNTNYFGSRANRPGFLVHSKGAVPHNAALLFSTLKTFTFNYLGQLLAMYKKSGVRNKALAASIGHLLVGSGIAGLPFSKDAQELLDYFTSSSSDAWIKEHLKNLFADNPSDTASEFVDALMYGLPRYLGLDASQSMGVGSIVGYRSSDSPTENLGSVLLGAPGGLIQRYFSAGSKALASGDLGSFISQTGPAPMRYWTNIINAADSSQVRNTSGVPTKVGTQDAVALATGFQSWSSAEGYRSYEANQLAANASNNATNALAERIAYLYARGDIDSAREEFNDGIKELGPSVDPVNLLNAINTGVFKRRFGYTRDVPTLAQQEGANRVSEIYGENASGIASPVSMTMQQLELARNITNAPVFADVLQSLPSAMRSSISREIAFRARVNPQLLTLLRSRKPLDRQRALAILSAPRDKFMFKEKETQQR